MSSKPSALVLPLYPSTAPAASATSLDIASLWASSNTKPDKALESRTFFDHTSAQPISVISLGKDAGKDGLKTREALRKAVATGVKAVKDNGGKQIGIVLPGKIDTEAHDAAVAATLALYDFTLKTKPVDPVPTVQPVYPEGKQGAQHPLTWETGKIYAESQNLARTLMELPANLMTPTLFCERISREFEGLDNITLTARDEAWAAEKGMRTFLSVTQGTAEPAKFLELIYNGAADQNARPLGLVGKGITFDSGGISLKPGAGMKLMRGDMGGAATVFATALAIVKLKLPINLIAVAPLAENLPSGTATKPGDVITSMNGKTVEVDNTDAEGRLVLSDALTYVSREFKPHTLLDVATLTGAMVIALGEVFTGVFSTSPELFSELSTAAAAEHDRVWPMPLDEEGFGPQIYLSSNADLCNTGGRPGGSCTAALFLKNFVEGIETGADGSEPTLRWAHLDIAGTMEATRPNPYQKKGMTGRPVRTLVEFARRLGGGQA